MKTYLDYINEAFNSKSLTDAQKEASRAEADLTKLQGQTTNFIPNKTRELVANDPALQQLNSERAKFAGQLYSKPFEARQQYGDILDPVKREALVSQSIGNVMGQLSGTEGMIGLRQQKNKDLADQAFNILQSKIDIGKTKYDKASGKADAISKLLTTAAGKEYDTQSAKDIARLKASLSGSGSDANKLLTVTEAKTFGVPYGTTRGQVFGKNVPNASVAQKDKNNFLSEYTQRNQIDIDPNSTGATNLYNDYVDAINAIRSASDPLKEYQDLIGQFPDLNGVLDTPKPISSSELLNQAILMSINP